MTRGDLRDQRNHRGGRVHEQARVRDDRARCCPEHDETDDADAPTGYGGDGP